MCIAAATVAAALLPTTGCSADDGGSERTRGAILFHEAGCADCHSLTAAGARARVGPDLDLVQLDVEYVARQVRAGGPGMPAFSDQLTPGQITALASFVSESTSGDSDAGGVEAARFTPDETVVADCSGRGACLEQAFGNIAYRRGPTAALGELSRRSSADERLAADCHRIAHRVAAAALRRNGGDTGRALVSGSTVCASGYYHGIAEQAFAITKDEELPRAARALCSEASALRTTFLAYQCLHGLGHGLMIATGYDLPRALHICDQLRAEWDRTSCTGGVFMENISSSYGIQSRWLREDDPVYPCNAVPSRHKLYCYLIVTSRILPLVGYDFSRAATVCTKTERAWVSTCFESYGRDASGYSVGDATRILELCVYATRHGGSCLYGAARDLVNTDASTGRAAALCRRAPPAHRTTCFEGIGTIVGDLFAADDVRTRACQAVSDADLLVQACLTGAGVPRDDPGSSHGP